MKRFMDWIFVVPTGERSVLDIVLWWERRRIAYNLIVGLTGFCSLLFFYFFISHTRALQPGDDAVEPIALLLAPVIMNICYTTGWVIEIILRKSFSEYGQVLGPRLLKAGLKFSLGVVALPATFWGGYWMLHICGFIK
jgi:hypothetical protein